GIRDLHVTGVRTCALPISCGDPAAAHLCLVFVPETGAGSRTRVTLRHLATGAALWQETMRAEPLPGDGLRLAVRLSAFTNPQVRSEERRAGKDGRWCASPT